MANYSVANSTVQAGATPAATATTYGNLITITPSSGNFNASNGAPVAIGLRRGKLYDILVGTAGTAADNYMEFAIKRATIGTTTVWTGGVSSVSSMYALDPADVGFSAAVVINTSVSGGSSTVGAAQIDAWYVGINQRASYRWVSAPGSEIVYPAATSAVANNGIQGCAKSNGFTGTATMTVMFQEQ